MSSDTDYVGFTFGSIVLTFVLFIRLIAIPFAGEVSVIESIIGHTDVKIDENLTQKSLELKQLMNTPSDSQSQNTVGHLSDSNVRSTQNQNSNTISEDRSYSNIYSSPAIIGSMYVISSGLLVNSILRYPQSVSLCYYIDSGVPIFDNYVQYNMKSTSYHFGIHPDDLSGKIKIPIYNSTSPEPTQNRPITPIRQEDEIIPNTSISIINNVVEINLNLSGDNNLL